MAKERKINNLYYKVTIMILLCLSIGFGIWHWTNKKIKELSNLTNKNNARVALVQKKKNSVLLNNSGSLLWLELNSGDSLYSGSSIQTSSNSTLQFKLVGGEEVTLGPQSLVRIEEATDKVIIQLVDGKIEVQPDLKINKLGERTQNQNAPAQKVVFVKSGSQFQKVKQEALKVNINSKKSEESHIEVITNKQNNVSSSLEVKEIEKIETEIIPEETLAETPTAQFANRAKLLIEESKEITLSERSIASEELKSLEAQAPVKPRVFNKPKVKRLQIKEVSE